MGKEVRFFMLAITASIFLNWVAAATVFADKPISVGPRVQPPNPQQVQAQSQPEQLRADPSSALGSRLILLPELGQASVKSQMSQDPGGPTKIGFGRDVATLSKQQDTQAQLNWQSFSGGMVGSLAISSRGAAAIRMGIRIQSMPDAAELRFFSDKAAEIQKVSGKTINDLISLNLKAGDPEETARVYWSPVINGEVIGLEIFIPYNISPSDVYISIPQVSHMTVTLENGGLEIGLQSTAASCEIDATCAGRGSYYAAKMVYTQSGSSFYCTGSLLIDNLGSRIPYFLTANHCISAQSSASSLITFWNYISSSCNGTTPISNYYQNTNGGTLLSTVQSSDSSLLRLNYTLASPQGYGWSTEPASLGAEFQLNHHPQGDLQKYSGG